MTIAAAHTRIVRVSAYSVSGILAALALTAALPPLVADQSDRAVVDAPINLITAPIAGEVSQLSVKVGRHFDRGETVGEIRNKRIDRTTLIQLEGKTAELRAMAHAASAQKASDLQYVAALDTEIRNQSEQTIGQLESQVAGSRARVAASEASDREKKAIVTRQTTMVARNSASAEMLKPTLQQYSAALHQKEAETAKLNQKLGQLAALRQGIYVGDDLIGLATLSQKRRDVSFDAKRLAIEEVQLNARLKDQDALLQKERARLDSLTNATLTAGGSGQIISVGVEPGRHVNAGDSLATQVDCSKAFVAAIFSYRQAQNLAVGTPVSVSGGGDFGTYTGTVSEIIPKTTDQSDDKYAVPFPQTERRELYVLVRTDKEINDPKTSGTIEGGCAVGSWVTVTRENGWVPSASVAWRSLQDGIASTFASLDAEKASAATRNVTESRR